MEAEQQDPYVPPEMGWEKIGEATWRAIDEDAGVVLYKRSGQLAAIPLHQTMLDADESPRR